MTFLFGGFALALVAMVVMARWQSGPSGSVEHRRSPASPGTDPDRGVAPGYYETGGFGSGGL